jgi:transcriptional regulator with XRE-family HTH domain
MARGSMTAAGRRIGLELRRLRLAAGLTLDDVARHMEWSTSKVSRLENAQSSALIRDVRMLCDLFGAGDEVTDGLVALAQRAKVTNGWWHKYGAEVLGGHYIPFEAQATMVHSYEVEVIPGLLQTADYTRAIMRGAHTGEPEEELQRRVQVRLDRQAALERETHRLRLWAVVGEAALHRRIGDRATMQAQLRHLSMRSEAPNIDVQILPFDAGAHPSLSSTFSVLHFEQGDPVVFENSVAATREVDDPGHASRCIEAFDYLRAAAESPERSRRIITDAATRLWERPEEG